MPVEEILLTARFKVDLADVDENVIVYDNDDFVERFKTDEGIIRARYFLKRRRIESKIRKGGAMG
jgi:hypothetical protein